MFTAVAFSGVTVNAAERTLPDSEAAVPGLKDPMRITELVLEKKGGRPAKLTGVLHNNSEKAFRDLWLSITPSDAAGTRFTPGGPVMMRDVKPRESRRFTYTLTGKLDFNSLAYGFKVSHASWPSAYTFVTAEGDRKELTFAGRTSPSSFIQVRVRSVSKHSTIQIRRLR